MLTSLRELLAQRGRGSAVVAFSCYDLQGILAVLRAAAAAGAGVVVLVGQRSYAAPDGRLLCAALRAAAERSAARACLQLDHCTDLRMIASALEDGFGAVMADGSALPYERNVELVAAAVELARRHGADVEAELGRVAGDEDVAAGAEPANLTDPGQAGAFVRRTGVACLAVSIGNVHGTYRTPPRLDWPRLEQLRRAVAVPLALHGTSGLPHADVARALRLGVAKVNVNTDLRRAYLAATRASIDAVLEHAELAALHDEQIRAVADVAGATLALCGGGSVGR